MVDLQSATDDEIAAELYRRHGIAYILVVPSQQDGAPLISSGMEPPEFARVLQQILATLSTMQTRRLAVDLDSPDSGTGNPVQPRQSSPAGGATIPQYFAEFGTDRIIRELFFPDPGYRGVMVEVGAATPVFLSMSQHFRLTGWRCICIEPNPIYAEMHRQRAHEIYEYACSDSDLDDQDFEVVHREADYEKNVITDHSFSALKVRDDYARADPGFCSMEVRKIKVSVRRLDTILQQLGIDSISFLSVDVEGWELEVMGGFSLQKYRPQVVLLENFLHAEEYTDYMAANGYRLANKLKYNYIFRPA